MKLSVAFCSDMRCGYYDRVAAGMQSALQREGEAELFTWKGETILPHAALPYLQVAGLVCAGIKAEVLTGLMDKTPVLGCSHAWESVPWPRVVNDDFAGGRLAAETLLQQGFTSLAVLMQVDQWHFQQRLAGVQAAALRADCACVLYQKELEKPNPGERFTEVMQRFTAAQAAFLRSLPPGCGVVAITPRDGTQLLQFFEEEKEAGRKSGIGGILCDIPDAADRGLAHVQFDAEKVGAVCAETLLAMIRRQGQPEHLTLIPPRGVREGSSLPRR